jgi:hypothetical protein
MLNMTITLNDYNCDFSPRELSRTRYNGRIFLYVIENKHYLKYIFPMIRVFFIPCSALYVKVSIEVYVVSFNVLHLELYHYTSTV